MAKGGEWVDGNGKPVSRYRELTETEFSSLTGIKLSLLRDSRSDPKVSGPPFIRRGKSIRYTLAQYEVYRDEITIYPGDRRRNLRRAG